MIDLVVDNRVRLLGSPDLSSLREAGALQELVDEHEHTNPDYQKAKHFKFYKRIPKLIVTWRDEPDGGLSFPRGSLTRIRELLRNHETRVADKRTRGDPDLGDIPAHHAPSGAMWPHQDRLIEAAIGRQNTLVRSAAASGKTCAALAFASRVNHPTLVVVHNSNLFKQWVDNCVTQLRVPRSWVGTIQGAHRRLGPITIGMQQTLYGCAAEVAPAFGCVVVDEVHRAASRTFLEVVDAMTAKYRIGVSDDERRSDGKEFLIYDMFGPVASEASHDELVDAGYVMDVRVRVEPTEFRADWYRKLKDSDKVKGYTHLLEALARDPERNKLAIKQVPLALAFGHQVILFTHRVEHALDLDRQINALPCASGFVVGEQPAESDETLRRFRDGRVNVVVGTYQSLGTGVDMPRVSRGVFVTPIANNEKARQQFKQYRGRFARTADGKKDAEIAYLWDRHVFGVRPLRHLRRWARDVKVHWRGGYVDAKQVIKELEDEKDEA